MRWKNGEPLESCLDFPSLVSFLFFGASWVNVLLKRRKWVKLLGA